LAEAAAPSDSLFLGAVYKYTHSLTHSQCPQHVSNAFIYIYFFKVLTEKLLVLKQLLRHSLPLKTLSLDRAQVPEKVKGCKVNSMSVDKQIIFDDPHVLKRSQFVNAHWWNLVKLVPVTASSISPSATDAVISCDASVQTSVNL